VCMYLLEFPVLYPLFCSVSMTLTPVITPVPATNPDWVMNADPNTDSVVNPASVINPSGPKINEHLVKSV
jgi:hypothetical protein